MHPFSILTLGIFIAGYITARWDLVTRLYELAIFAIDHGVVVSLKKNYFGSAHLLTSDTDKNSEGFRSPFYCLLRFHHPSTLPGLL